MALSLYAGLRRLYFFNPQILELLVKIVNGCSANGAYWFFYGSTSNVELEYTVEDLQAWRDRDRDRPPRPVRLGRRQRVLRPVLSVAPARSSGSALQPCAELAKDGDQLVDILAPRRPVRERPGLEAPGHRDCKARECRYTKQPDCVPFHNYLGRRSPCRNRWLDSRGTGSSPTPPLRWAPSGSAPDRARLAGFARSVRCSWSEPGRSSLRLPRPPSPAPRCAVPAEGRRAAGDTDASRPPMPPLAPVSDGESASRTVILRELCSPLARLRWHTVADSPSAFRGAACRGCTSGRSATGRERGDRLAILAATVSGEPTDRAPSGPAARSNWSRVIGRPAALARRCASSSPVVRPELVAGLVVGVGDVAGRVDADRQLVVGRTRRAPGGRARRTARSGAGSPPMIASISGSP